jgi:hypothetical protein
MIVGKIRTIRQEGVGDMAALKVNQFSLYFLHPPSGFLLSGFAVDPNDIFNMFFSQGGGFGGGGGGHYSSSSGGFGGHGPRGYRSSSGRHQSHQQQYHYGGYGGGHSSYF